MAPETAPPASFPPLPLSDLTPSSIALSTSACETPSGRSSSPALRLPFSTFDPTSPSSDTNGGTTSVSTIAISAIPATTTSSEAARGCIPRSRSRCASGTSSVASSSATTTGSTTSSSLPATTPTT